MFGVIKDTFDSDGGSMSGDEDFFSVASTMPLVAGYGSTICSGWETTAQLTFDSQTRYTLVNSVQCV